MKLLLLALTIALLPAARAAEPSAASPLAPAHAKRTAMTREDWQFMRQAAAAGRAEIAAGKLAQARASDPAVRAFGKELAQDHDAAIHHLALLALDTQIPLPQRASSEDRKQLDRLQKLAGEAFDQAFVTQFGIAAHRQSLALFGKEAKSTTLYPALRHYAQETLPMLQRHLDAALRLQAHAVEGHSAVPAQHKSS